MAKKNKGTNDFILPGMEAFQPNMINENDASLEDELFQLLGETETPKSHSRSTNKKPTSSKVNPAMLNLKLDDDDGNDDEFDENDPELLAELNDVLGDNSSGPSPKVSPNKIQKVSDSMEKLESLKINYREAIEQAKISQNTSKVRSHERALKTIEDLIGKVKRGVAVNEEDFPPRVLVKHAATVKSIETSKSENKPVEVINPTTAVQPIKNTNQKIPALAALINRQNEYKKAALDAKKSNNIELAKGLMIMVKQFDQVVEMVKSGEPFDLSELPKHPSEFSLADLPLNDNEGDEDNEEEEKASSKSGNAQQTFDSEIQERLNFYKQLLDKADSESNSSKVKRMSRIVQQYEEALVAYKRGGNTQQSYNYSALPPPPGKTPLSLPNATNQTPSASTQVKQNPSAASVPQAAPRKVPMNNTVALLKDRQTQFKLAALKAKKDNDLELAKELLRQSMGIEKMCQAAESGLPVDLSQIPKLPCDIGSDFEICDIPAEMIITGDNNDPKTVLSKLEKALMEQVELCRKYEQQSTQAGDVINARKFKELMSMTRKDLDGLKCLGARAQLEVPKFHYEYRLLNVSHANPELGEGELGVEIIKASQLPLPENYNADQLDTYVVLTLPIPSAEQAQTFTSDTIKRTNCPEYKSTTKFQINIKSRSLIRLINHKTLKAEIYYRRGILKSDKILGTAQMKLSALEKLCTIHENCDLYEGRKLVAGKLEIRLKTRKPLGGGDTTEQVKEKWLVIDEFNRNADKVAMQQQINEVTSKSREEDLGSVDVLRYELNEMRKVLSSSGSNNLTLAATVRQRIREKEIVLQKQEEIANSSNNAQRLAYLQYLASLIPQMTKSAKEQLIIGNRDKAHGIVSRKAIVERELERRKKDNVILQKKN